MQCLLDALRGELSSRVVDAAEWELAIALADEQRMLPLVAKLALHSGIALPPEIQARLATAKREALHYSFLQTSELKELLRAFGAGAIPVIPLKGPWLAQRVYGAASLRISSDLDLLVRRADFSAASLLLESLNFTPESVPDDYHQKWSREATIVELHFDVENPLAIDFNVAAAWKNAQQQDFGGQTAWRLAARDEFHYLCLHGVRHRFDRLSLIVDIALSRRQLACDGNSQLCLASPREHEAMLLLLGCTLAHKLYPRDPSVSVSANHETTSRIGRLADRLWNDLLTKPLTQQDWVSMHRFYLEIEATPVKKLYRRFLHLRILLTRIIDEDFRFAARFGLKRKWQVWLLRQARLVTQRRGSWLSTPRF